MKIKTLSTGYILMILKIGKLLINFHLNKQNIIIINKLVPLNYS